MAMTFVDGDDDDNRPFNLINTYDARRVDPNQPHNNSKQQQKKRKATVVLHITIIIRAVVFHVKSVTTRCNSSGGKIL